MSGFLREFLLSAFFSLYRSHNFLFICVSYTFFCWKADILNSIMQQISSLSQGLFLLIVFVVVCLFTDFGDCVSKVYIPCHVQPLKFLLSQLSSQVMIGQKFLKCFEQINSLSLWARFQCSTDSLQVCLSLHFLFVQIFNVSQLCEIWPFSGLPWTCAQPFRYLGMYWSYTKPPLAISFPVFPLA